jgi:hypothetical protein
LAKKQQLTRICGRQNNLEEMDDLIAILLIINNLSFYNIRKRETIGHSPGFYRGGSSNSTYEASHWTLDNDLDSISLPNTNARIWQCSPIVRKSQKS